MEGEETVETFSPLRKLLLSSMLRDCWRLSRPFSRSSSAGCATGGPAPGAAAASVKKEATSKSLKCVSYNIEERAKTPELT